MNATFQQPETSTKTVHQSLLAESDRQPRPKTTSDHGTVAVQQKATTQPIVPPVVIPIPSQVKTMDKGRFALGLLLSFVGVCVLLFVVVGLLQQPGNRGWFSLPIVAVTAIAAVTILGGGFGMMVTASADLDDGEFERLIMAGNIANVCRDRSQSSFGDAQQRPNVPAGRSSQQRDTHKV